MTYLVQIDDEIREATEAEAEMIAAEQAKVQKRIQDEASKAEAKAALLERLGITPEEAALLVQ